MMNNDKGITIPPLLHSHSVRGTGKSKQLIKEINCLSKTHTHTLSLSYTHTLTHTLSSSLSLSLSFSYAENYYCTVIFFDLVVVVIKKLLIFSYSNSFACLNVRNRNSNFNYFKKMRICLLFY